MNLKKLIIEEYVDLGIMHQDSGPWRSYELSTSGYTLEELRENAYVSQIDKDGGELEGPVHYEEFGNDVINVVEKHVRDLWEEKNGPKKTR